MVIGNPPYGFHQIHEAYAKEYFRKKFKTIKGSFENYFLFYEATLRLLKRSGLHGFIVPVTWLTIPSAHELRKYILENFALREIVWLPELVFRNAQVNTLISILENGRSGTTRAMISDSTNPYSSTGTVHIFDQQSFIDFDFTIHIFDEPHETELLAKIKRDSSPLGNIATPRSGYNPYEVGTGLTPTGQPHSKETIQTRPYHSSKKLGPEWTPELIGRHLGRYQLNWPGDRFVKYGAWLSAPRDPNNFVGPRLLVQEITGGASRRVVATFTNQLFHHSRDIIPVKCTRDWPSPLFLLGVVNSRLITWWHHHRSPKSRKQLFPKVLVRDVRDFPVPELQRDDPADVERHDRMVSLVQQMLDLNEQLDTARTDQDKRHLQRLIDHTDREIDTLVYELYDLTDEEIAIVEEEVG